MPTIEVGAESKRDLQCVADILAKSKKVVVVTGAGISTNSGIPDFRSENGLYSLIQSHYDAAAAQSSRASSEDTEAEDEASLPSISSQESTTSTTSSTKLPTNMKGRDMFDALIWSNPLSTSIFYTFIAALRKKIREEVRHTTPTHRFIRTLRDGGKLVRCYTQNIDGLETRDGLCTSLDRGKGNRARFTQKVVSKPRPEGPILPGSASDGGCEVVQLHGDLSDLRCGLCNQLCSWEEDERETTLLGGEAPECRLCAAQSEDRLNRGKRGLAVGTLRPNVVLYGEENPASNQLSPITTHDLGLNPDVLLILGTSLRVHGLKVLVKEFAKSVHARAQGKGKVIFVNKTKPPDSVWADVIDYWIGLDCDEWVHDLRERRADIWERQGTLHLPIVKGPKTGKTKPTAADALKTKTLGASKDESIPAPKSSTTAKKLVVHSPASKATRAKPRPKPRPKKRQPLSAVSTNTTPLPLPDTTNAKALQEMQPDTALTKEETTIPTTPRKPKTPHQHPQKEGEKENERGNTQLATPPGSRSRDPQRCEAPCALEYSPSSLTPSKRRLPPIPPANDVESRAGGETHGDGVRGDDLMASPSKRKRRGGAGAGAGAGGAAGAAGGGEWQIWVDV